MERLGCRPGLEIENLMTLLVRDTALPDMYRSEGRIESCIRGGHVGSGPLA